MCAVSRVCGLLSFLCPLSCSFMYLAAAAAEEEEEVSSLSYRGARARVCRTKAARGQKSLSSNYRAQSHYQIVLFKRGPRCRIYFSANKKLGGLLLMNPAKSLDGQPQEFVPSDMAAKTTYILVDNLAFWRTGSGTRLPHDILIARRKVLLANKKQ